DIYDLKLAVTEAVTNVIRHAAVESYEVEFKVLRDAVEVTVTDTGGGLQVSELPKEPDDQGGFGLTVIEN
ncbi:ATP-binding protein, partial [Staphylococcus aureus]|uniref:ATP-binding protein n=1 Tax=Staphylococcus aureus TaxID=1280 RepID=UPI001023CB33